MADENQSAVFNFVDDDTESCPVRRTLDLLQGSGMFMLSMSCKRQIPSVLENSSAKSEALQTIC